MSDEVKAIPLEERMARIREAMKVAYISNMNAWYWAHLFRSAYDGQQYAPPTNSTFFREVLEDHPKTVEILGSLVHITPKQLQRIKKIGASG